MNKDLIKNCILYITKKRQVIDLNIKTNGFLIDINFFEFLKKYNVNIDISIDGPKHIHDSNRVLSNGKGTFDTILNNIISISKNNLEYLLKHFSLTITYGQNNSIVDIVDYFNNHSIFKLLDVSFISLNPIGAKFDIGKSLYNKNNDLKLSKKYLKQFEDNRWNNLNIEHAYFYPLIKYFNELEPLNTKEHIANICSLSKWRLFVDVNGNFRVCERTSRLPIIGNVEKGVYWDIIKNMELDFLSTTKKCNSCWAISICNVCWTSLYGENNKIDVNIKNRICKEALNKYSLGIKLYSKIMKSNKNAFDLIPEKL